MRQRKLKYVNECLLASLDIITEENKLTFKSDSVFLEIGSGKGKFITDLASKNSNNTYIALEKSMDACYRIYEKKLLLNLNNLIIINLDAKVISNIFAENSLNGIYLNFSDPWQKKKHHKRRLTSKDFLKTYYLLLKDEAFIQFRTDHEQFFFDSLIALKIYFKTIKIDYNLAPSEFMTEYEIKKRELGPIFEYLGGKYVK